MSDHGGSNSSSSDDEDYNPAEVVAVVPEPPNDVEASTATTHAEQVPPGSSARAPLAKPAVPPSVSAPQPAAPSPLDDLPMEHGGVRLHAIKGRVRCLGVNRRGTLLCAGGEDGQLVMWDFNVDLPTRRVQPTRVITPFVNRVSGLQPIVALTFAQDESYLVACQDGDCPVLVAAGGRTLGYCAMGERGLADVVQCKGHRAPVTDCAAHAGEAGRFYTCSQDGTARLWDHTGFERKSLYTVKHGSGHITDTVVVEAVRGLSEVGGGAVFATGGEDGCVQLWDARAKYRPGGVMAAWDVYALPRVKSGGAGGRAGGAVDEVFERHTGGIAELAGPVLAVRRGDLVQFLDIRATKGLSSGGNPLPPPKTKGATTTCLACDAFEGLPYVTDTTSLVTAPASSGATLVTCTSRAGFHKTLGGHVVCLDVAAGVASEAGVRITSTWRAGTAEEDVLCAAVDGSGRLFAGLGTGDVVVQREGLSDTAPVERWLASRPQRAEQGTGRLAGEKSIREELDIGVEDLF